MKSAAIALLTAALGQYLFAQPAADPLVEQIEKYASLQERRLGLQTRLTAADRLRATAPAAARRLLEDSVPLLTPAPGTQPDYFVYRVLNSYAAIDLDAAERLLARCPETPWAYTALIEQSTRQGDLPRAIRLTQAAIREHYSLGVIPMLLQRLRTENVASAAALTDELVRRFPGQDATLTNVQSLLTYVAQADRVDPVTGKRAALLAIQALDRPGIKPAAPEFENTATYTAKTGTIQTKTGYETALLPAMAFLAAFDPEEYRRRAAGLPEWKNALAGITPAELPALIKSVRYMRMSKELAGPAGPSTQPSASSFSQMPFDEALTFVANAPPDNRAMMLVLPGRRPGLSVGQQNQVWPRAIEAARNMTAVAARYNVTGVVFREIVERKLDAQFMPALKVWLEVLDSAVHSKDPNLAPNHDSGAYAKDYAAIAQALDTRGITLPEPNASIEVQRVLRTLE